MVKNAKQFFLDCVARSIQKKFSGQPNLSRAIRLGIGSKILKPYHTSIDQFPKFWRVSVIWQHDPADAMCLNQEGPCDVHRVKISMLWSYFWRHRIRGVFLHTLSQKILESESQPSMRQLQLWTKLRARLQLTVVAQSQTVPDDDLFLDLLFSGT